MGSKPLHRLTAVDSDARTAICDACGPVKIHKHARASGSVNWRCAKHNTENVRQWANTHGWRRDSHGLTAEQADEFKAGKVCAICGSSQKLRVDHDHRTRVIRGVLCNSCNIAIGALGDSVEGLRRALAYLESAPH